MCGVKTERERDREKYRKKDRKKEKEINDRLVSGMEEKML